MGHPGTRVTRPRGSESPACHITDHEPGASTHRGKRSRAPRPHGSVLPSTAKEQTMCGGARGCPHGSVYPQIPLAKGSTPSTGTRRKDGVQKAAGWESAPSSPPASKPAPFWGSCVSFLGGLCFFQAQNSLEMSPSPSKAAGLGDPAPSAALRGLRDDPFHRNGHRKFHFCVSFLNTLIKRIVF